MNPTAPSTRSALARSLAASLSADGPPETRSAFLDAARALGAQMHQAGADCSRVAMEISNIREEAANALAGSPDAPAYPSALLRLCDDGLAAALDSHANRERQARGAFLSVLGHDLRGPLSAIALAHSVLRKPTLTDESRARSTRAAIRAGQELGSLLGELMAHAMQQIHGPVAIDPREVDFAGACREAADRARARHPDRDASAEGPTEIPGVGDPAKIAWALDALLDAAARRSGSSEPLSLLYAEDGDDVVVSARPAGPHPADDPARWGFDAMARLRASDLAPGAAPSGRLGLGLDAAARIAAAHGGEAWTEPEGADGERSSLWLRFAREPAAPEPLKS